VRNILAFSSPVLFFACLWSVFLREPSWEINSAAVELGATAFSARGGPESDEYEVLEVLEGEDPYGHAPGFLRASSADLDASCHDAPCGSRCKNSAIWAKTSGCKNHPEWYGGLTCSSSIKEFQMQLYKTGQSGCPKPCIGADEAKTGPLPAGPIPEIRRVHAANGLPLGHPKADFVYPKREGFTLWLVEEFDTPLDLLTDPIWTYSDGGLAEGRVRFIKEGIKFRDGKMILELAKSGLPQGHSCSHAEVGTIGQKELTSGEMRTRYNMFRYGYYEVSMKTPSVQPGNPWVNGNYVATMFAYRDAKFRHWREIDIEILGGHHMDVATNVINGDHQAKWASWFQDDKPSKPWWIQNTRSAFHTYAFEWLPKKITWYADGKVLRTYVWGKVNVPDLSTKIMMNLWVYNGGQFGGKEVWNNRYPMQAEYDWLRFYKWDEEAMYPCAAMNSTCLTEDDQYLASNNPCDGIPQLGDRPGGCSACVGKCQYA